MFLRYIIYMLVVLLFQNGCMLIGYDSVTDGSQLDSKIDSSDASGDSRIDTSRDGPNDGTVNDASSARDSTLPDAMDAAEAAIVSDSTMDSPQQDAAETGTDSRLDDDAPTDMCQPEEFWCDGDSLMSCNASGLAEVEQECSSLSNACEIGACNESENRCEKRPRSSETRFCDGDMLMTCNGQGSSEVAKDCSSDSDMCNSGVCNSTTGQCKLEPRNSGMSWCEGNVLYTCNSDGSSVISRDCSDLSDACNTGMCDPTKKLCDATPVQADTVCLGNGTCDDSGTCLCTPDDSWCYNNKLINCDSSGNISGMEDCGLLGNVCNAGVCDSDGKTCNTVPNTGSVCGTFGTCDAEGNCVMNTSDCSSETECQLTCSSDISPCVLDCGDASSCSVTCEEDATCAIGCASSETCDILCKEGATCTVECGSSNLECAIDCTQALSCSNITCPIGVYCIANCNPLDSGCGFDDCSDTSSCGSGVYSCNGSCPSVD